jgi:hypothetical protein
LTTLSRSSISSLSSASSAACQIRASRNRGDRACYPVHLTERRRFP